MSEDEEELGEIEPEGDDEIIVESVETALEELVEDGAGEEEEELVLDLAAEERLETLSIRPTPKQPNEFVCSNCHLVKHLSQLAHRKKQLCRDCV
jgi:hypothetical protein